MQRFNLGGGFNVLHATDPVAEYPQRALCRDLGIKLTQAACCSVAWIGKSLVASIFLGSIKLLEICEGDIDLSAYIKNLGVRGCESVWDVADGFDVFGNVFADKSIATGTCLDQFAMFIS